MNTVLSLRVILRKVNAICEYTKQPSILCYRFSCVVDHYQVVSQKPWNEVFIYLAKKLLSGDYLLHLFKISE